MPVKDKQEQINALLEKVEEGTLAVFESDNYKNYLRTMSKFHNYSFRNSLLISLQKSDATYVAGYKAWQTKFKRQVNKGEKGIQIIGFSKNKIEVEKARKDNSGNNVYGDDGQPIKDTITKEIPRFRPVYVYDVSQTSGEPLPKLIHDLSGSVEEYSSFMAAISEICPVPIEYEDIKGGADGYYSLGDKRIALQQGMSEVQTAKTAIHELAHAVLHDPGADKTGSERKSRETMEVEAESIAFVVSSYYGIDTSEYSFPYLAGWSSDRELSDLHNSLETIQKQAGDMISRIDTRLAELLVDVNREGNEQEIAVAGHNVAEKQEPTSHDNQSLAGRMAAAKEAADHRNAAAGSSQDTPSLTRNTEQEI